MPRTITITKEVYTFDELDSRAKERARDWWRELESQDFTFANDDFLTVASILGVEIDTHEVRSVRGRTWHEPNIYWMMHVQGAGACFEGSYRYAENSTRAIREHAPLDEQLHSIADRLAGIQMVHGYKLAATIKHRDNSYHEYSASIAVTHADDDSIDIDEHTEKFVVECLRDLMRWLYREVESQYDWTMGDEHVDESIVANEYTFDKQGNRLDVGEDD
jgi:hypothetical protein